MADKKVPNLKAKYQAEVAPALMQKFGYKSVMQIPKIDKIVVNCGCGEARDNSKVLEAVVGDLTKITGQKAIITKAKKSVANFKLREGMTWTNGEPVTAKDFTFAWEKLLTKDTGSNYAYFAYIFKNGEKFYNGECGIEDVGFKAVSDYELEVTLEGPTPYALFTFSFGSLAPVNQKFYEEVGADKYMTEAQYFNTNGAFKVESWTHDDSIVLVKNPDFYDADKVQLDKINCKMIIDSAAQLNAFQAGELDVCTLNADSREIMVNEDYPIQSYSDGAEFHMLFNTNNEVLANANIRKALSLAIDREAFIAAIAKGAAGCPPAPVSPPVRCPPGRRGRPKKSRRTAWCSSSGRGTHWPSRDRGCRCRAVPPSAG